MRKLIVFGCLLLSTTVYADRLGSLRSDADVLLSSQALSGVSVYPATATASFPFGFSASTITVSSTTVFPGATFYGENPTWMSAIRWPDGTIQVSSPIAGGSAELPSTVLFSTSNPVSVGTGFKVDKVFTGGSSGTSYICDPSGSGGTTHNCFSGLMLGEAAIQRGFYFYVAGGATSNYAMYVDAGDIHMEPLTASTPLKLNASKNIISADIDLTTDITGNLPVTNLNSGTDADSSHFWRGDGQWISSATFGGGGGVSIYPATATASFPFGISSSTGIFSSSVTLSGGDISLPESSNSQGRIFIDGHKAFALPTNNIYIGKDTGNYGVGDQGSICMGSGACQSTTHDYYSVAIGYNAAQNRASSDECVIIGNGAGQTSGGGWGMTAIGSNALKSYTCTSAGATAMGAHALESATGSTGGKFSTCIGYYCGNETTSGQKNTAIGYYAQKANTTGSYNTSVGTYAQSHSTTTNYNVAIGWAANGLDTGSGTPGNNASASTFIGALSGTDSPTETYSNAIAIGYAAKAACSNCMILGAANYGVKIGIGTKDPQYGLDVQDPTGISSQYMVTAGSYTGAGLTTCGDSTHALGYDATTGLFDCQALSSGGGGEAIFSVNLDDVQITSPTATIRFDSGAFGVALNDASTAYVTLNQVSLSTGVMSYLPALETHKTAIAADTTTLHTDWMATAVTTGTIDADLQAYKSTVATATGTLHSNWMATAVTTGTIDADLQAYKSTVVTATETLHANWMATAVTTGTIAENLGTLQTAVAADTTTIAGNLGTIQTAVAADTTTIAGNLGTLQTAVAADTTTIAGNLSSHMTAIAADTTTIAGNLGTIQTAVAADTTTIAGNLDTVQQAVATDTTTLQGNIDGKLDDYSTVVFSTTPITKCMVIESPTDADNFLFYRTTRAMTVTEVDCLVGAATSAVVTLQECDANGGSCGTVEALTCAVTNTQSTDIDDSAIAAGAWLRLDVGTVTDTPGQVNFCMTYQGP